MAVKSLKSQKKKRLFIIIGIVAALAVIIGAVFTFGGTERKLQKQLDLGQKYLDELNYEQAIICYTSAIEIEPKCWDAYFGLASAYHAKGDINESVSALEQGMSQVDSEEVSEEDIDFLISMYEEQIIEAELNGEQDLVLEIYKKIQALNPKNTEIKEKVKILEEVDKYENALKTMVLEIVQEENYSFSDETILSEEFQNLVKNIESPIIFQTENGLFLAVYPGGYIYYGEMIAGMRQGQGCWYYGTLRAITVVDSMWENDFPNGLASIHKIINPDLIEKEENHTYALDIEEKVTLKDGIYDGTSHIVWTMDSGEVHVWDVAYSDGKLIPIDGDYAGYCENCGASLQANSDYDYVYQIEGIEKE